MKSISIATLLCASLPCFSAPILVGVLEVPQCKEEVPVSVRVLFTSESGKWRALGVKSDAMLPTEAAWAIAFDGRVLGSVKTFDMQSKTLFGWSYPRDRMLALTPNQTPPTISNKNEQFAGWCELPKNRPLVALSKSHVSDPDHWKSALVKPDVVARLLPEFKKRIGTVLYCPDNPEIGVPFPFSALDIDVETAYLARDGRQLISLRLKSELNSCDWQSDTEWSNHVFLVSSVTNYIGPGLELVDAGDYDADGKSELLFWYTAYNKDGYSLLSEGVMERADYFWSYH